MGPSYTDGHVVDCNEPQTGLLMRFVPEKLKHSALYRWFLRLTRLLQFISATVPLSIFSQRLHKVYHLVNSIKSHRGVNGSYGAAEDILAAAVLYTLINVLFTLIRWLGVLFDLLFVGAFITVAVLTSPKGGKAGPRHCYGRSRFSNENNLTDDITNATDASCNLSWGTFILAIISTLLHAITVAFHDLCDHHKKNIILQRKRHLATTHRSWRPIRATI
ncbi:hypothetical protein M501DRAFT_1052687 [Patellaria atrata CBS 101060]|uniref:MARVEL domain-containing protein n=1 Tax=Patellaria atrata CBS 101060 TaxID=1346257 RepID=A0A9P4SAG6_9PEZI|nr:hypothetical protein M501DRAFT_1052687 [Patellaria atrata CBS 101060]